MPRSLEHKQTSIASLAILTGIVLACLLPFITKAFNIDDYLFIKVAHQIQSDPLNFYGFNAIWYGTEMPMSAITKNPPLASSYSALVAYLFGWGEASLHGGFLLIAIVAAIGSYRLAQEFCTRPLIASLAGIFTPVFLVSSSTVMCDTMMLAFWVWALFFWVRGIKCDRLFLLGLSALLIATCSLTKYYGMCLIPLVVAYAAVKKRRVGSWALPLLIPLVILAGYQYLTFRMYGRGLLLDAGSYAVEYSQKKGPGIFFQTLSGLVFTGGCLITALFYSSLLWRKTVLVSGAVAAMLLVGALSCMQRVGNFPIHTDTGVNWPFVIQYSIFLLGGVSILALAVVDSLKRKDADSLLLLLWVMGTFIFASFLNWSLNGRSILPMAPAVGILLMRRIETSEGTGKQWPILVPLVPAALVALAVTWGDARLAATAREAATVIRLKYASNVRNLWFQGHWGFQHYMELAGGKAVDMGRSYLVGGDVVIIPLNATNLYPFSPTVTTKIDNLQFTASRWVSTMDHPLGAGFYSDIWGPLPFAFGPVDPEDYYIFLMTGSMPAWAARLAPDGN